MALSKMCLLLLLPSVSFLSTRAKDPTCKILESLQTEYEQCPSIPNPGNGTFYIKLERAKMIPILDNANDTLNSICDNSSRSEFNLSDMCGATFRDRQTIITEVIHNSTCPTYKNISSENSVLGICEEVFQSLGYCISLVPYNDSGLRLYNDRTLKENVTDIESSLKVYFNVLDRTIVGSLFKSSDQRCLCLDSYKKWICTSKLKGLYTNDTSGIQDKDLNSCCSLNTSTGDLYELKPCLGVCERTVQTCPYYIPSSFQDDSSTRRRGDTRELVYGGYPAFDCPRRNTLVELYSTNNCIGHGDRMPTYANPNCPLCINNTGVVRTAPLWVVCALTCLVLFLSL